MVKRSCRGPSINLFIGYHEDEIFCYHPETRQGENGGEHLTPLMASRKRTFACRLTRPSRDSPCAAPEFIPFPFFFQRARLDTCECFAINGPGGLKQFSGTLHVPALLGMAG